MTFDELLSRAAEQTLQALIGKPVIRLLSRLDSTLLQPERLREVVLGLRTPQELLLAKDSRALLLELLPRGDAQMLADRLGLGSPDVYVALKTMTVARGSRRLKDLLDFFSLPEPVDLEVDLAPSSADVTPAHALFRHQRVAARRVVALLREEPHRVLLHMPTGSGKTRTAMSVIAEMLNQQEPMLVIWLAHSEELCEQAASEFERAWSVLGNRALPVYRWWGDHPMPVGELSDGFLVAGLAKAFAAARRDVATIGKLAGLVRLVVMDEAHQAIAPTYEHVLSVLTQAGEPAALLGLSATPGRTWNDIGEDERLADFFSQRKVPLEVDGYDSPIDYLIEKGYLAQTEFEPLFYASGRDFAERDLRSLEDSLDIPSGVLQQLAEDEKRNLLILNRTESLLRSHKRILVFATTVDHAKVLATVLRARGVDADVVTGSTPPDERARVIDRYRATSDAPRVLVNYGVLTTGFDAPQTSAAVIARPTKSLVLYSQMVGRATRGPRVGGNRTAQIVTVVDTSLPGFASLTEAFHNWEDVWAPAQ